MFVRVDGGGISNYFSREFYREVAAYTVLIYIGRFLDKKN